MPAGELRPRDFLAWRVVEAQHRFATDKLVDGADEQRLLEEMIETAKPPLPDTDEFVGLHYLLSTPFRYPPLRHGSRFGGRDERGLWYGAQKLPTALAEVAFYRLVFLAGTRAALDHVETVHQAHRVRVRARRAADLARPAFDDVRAAAVDPGTHTAGRALGRRLRAAGAEAVLFPSARDPEHRPAVGVFTPRVFTTRAPEHGSEQTWHCATRPTSVTCTRLAVASEPPLVFARETFEVDGELPVPE